MAMIDYGAIVLKNGKLINNQMFVPMEEAVGWTDENVADYEGNPMRLKNNYFNYIGDSEHTIGFYKTSIVYVAKYADHYYKKSECFANLYTWIKWEYSFGDLFEKIVVTHQNGYYVLRWKYKGDKYKVYFGCGVDNGSYERWRIVNYYRSPVFLWDKYSTIVKEKFKKIIFQKHLTKENFGGTIRE